MFILYNLLYLYDEHIWNVVPMSQFYDRTPNHVIDTSCEQKISLSWNMCPNNNTYMTIKRFVLVGYKDNRFFVGKSTHMIDEVLFHQSILFGRQWLEAILAFNHTHEKRSRK